MAWPRIVHSAVIKLVVIGAIFSLILMDPSIKALAAGTSPLGEGDGIPLGSDGADHRDFLEWILMPFTVPMYVLLAIFIVGALVGTGFTYLRYHLFKLDFERLGKILLMLMPPIAIAAVAATLALHRYNLFLLSLYLAVPMVVVPLLYIVYDTLHISKSDRKRL